MPIFTVRQSPKFIALVASVLTFISWALTVGLVQRWHATEVAISSIRGEIALQDRLNDVLLRLGNLDVDIEQLSLREQLAEVPEDDPKASIRRAIRVLGSAPRLHNETSVVLSYSAWAVALPARISVPEEIAADLQTLADQLQQCHVAATIAMEKFESKRRELFSGKTVTLDTVSEEDAKKSVALIRSYYNELSKYARTASELHTSMSNAVANAVAAADAHAQWQSFLALCVGGIATLALTLATIFTIIAGWMEMRADAARSENHAKSIV